jgi:proteasome lid subunit RPN8/RPN11
METLLTTALYEPERFRSSAYLAVLDETSTNEKLYISTQCLDNLRRVAETGYPLEVCGLLVGTIDNGGWNIQQLRPVANLNTERAADRFQLDPAAYQSVDRELRSTNLEIVGVYHSHPDCPAKPSPTDLVSAWEGFAYPIVSIYDGKAAEIRCWSLNTDGDRFRETMIVETTP